MKFLPSLFISGALSTFAIAQDLTVYQSDFGSSEGARPDGWRIANSVGGVEAVVSGGDLEIRSGEKTEMARNFVIRKFDPVTLAKDGDFIAMTFVLTNGEVPVQNNNIRFGLFDSKGSPLMEDASGPDPVELRDDAGCYFRLATNPESDAGNVSRYYVSSGKGQTAALTGNLGEQSQLGDESMTGVVRSNQNRKIEMILTRQGETLDFKVLFRGNVQTGGRVVDNPPTFTFDEAVFSIASPGLDVRVSDMVIETNAKR